MNPARRAAITVAARNGSPIAGEHVVELLEEMEKVEGYLTPLAAFFHDLNEAFSTPVFLPGHECRAQTVLGRVYRQFKDTKGEME